MLCVALEVCLYSAVTLQGWDSLLKLLWRRAQTLHPICHQVDVAGRRKLHSVLSHPAEHINILRLLYYQDRWFGILLVAIVGEMSLGPHVWKDISHLSSRQVPCGLKPRP